VVVFRQRGWGVRKKIRGEILFGGKLSPKTGEKTLGVAHGGRELLEAKESVGPGRKLIRVRHRGHNK